MVTELLPQLKAEISNSSVASYCVPRNPGDCSAWSRQRTSRPLATKEDIDRPTPSDAATPIKPITR